MTINWIWRKNMMKKCEFLSLVSCACLASGMLALPASAKHISGNDFKVEKNDILTIDNLKRIVTDVKEDGSYTAIPLGDWFEEQNNCLRRTLFDRYTNTVNFYGVGLNGVALEEPVGGNQWEYVLNVGDHIRYNDGTGDSYMEVGEPVGDFAGDEQIEAVGQYEDAESGMFRPVFYTSHFTKDSNPHEIEIDNETTPTKITDETAAGTPILKDYGEGDLVRSVYLGKEADETSSEPLAEWLQEGNLENYEVYTMADHELNDMNFYLKKDPASAEDAAYVQNLQIDDIVGITINSQTNQVSAIEKVFAVNEDGEFATDVIWLQ